MKLVTSTNIYFERTYEPAITVKECIEKCAMAGYEYLDFGFMELSLISESFKTSHWEQEIIEYKELAQQYGISFPQAHSFILDFCNEESVTTKREELFKRSILGAKILGVEWLVVHPSTGIKDGKMDPDTHQKNVEFFKKYAIFAKEQGVGLAIENMWGKAKGDIKRYAIEPAEVLKLIEDIGEPNVKVCWDVEHASIENLDHKEALHTIGKHLVATHVSDEAGIQSIHILPYTGRIHWNEIIEAMANIQYDGTFDFEIQHYLPKFPKELVPSAMKFSKEVGAYLVEQIEVEKRKRLS